MAHPSGKKSALIALRAAGKSLRVCARELGINRETAGKWSKQFEAEITAQRREELEAIAEEYRLLRAGRLQMIGGMVARLDAEIARRDLGEIPTPALLYLRAEWQRIAQAEAAALDAVADAEAGATAGNPVRRLVDLFKKPKPAETFLEALHAADEEERKREAEEEKRKREAARLLPSPEENRTGAQRPKG